jgi:hypothetical protein
LRPDPCVVDDDVETAESSDHVGDRGPDRAVIGDVAAHTHERGLDVRLQIEARHSRTAFREHHGGRQANAGRPAGHDRAQRGELADGDAFHRQACPNV